MSREQLQVCLDEFVFRLNRRRLPLAAFQTRLGLGTRRKPTPYKEIRVPGTFLIMTKIRWGLLRQPGKQKLSSLAIASVAQYALN